MLNVGIDIERLRNPNSGLGQFCYHLSESLQNLQQTKMKWHFYVPKNNILVFPNSQIYKVTAADKLLGVKNKHLHLFHCTHQDSHLFPAKIPAILTIHDLNFLEKYTRRGKQQQKLKALQSKIKKAKGLTFISNYTKQLVEQHLDISAIPSKVIYNGNCLNQQLQARKPVGLANKPFLFSIGIVNPKKNFHVLLPLLLQAPFQLVIAGNNSHAYAEEIKQIANQLGVSEKLKFLGAVSEEEKLWLYQQCEAFVFPSLAEGFGLPVIEAMSIGKPVFLSRKTSLPEIGGTLAYYWDNFEPAHMIEVFAGGMENFQNSKTKSDELIAWSENFNWKKTAQEYVDFYAEVYQNLK